MSSISPFWETYSGSFTQALQTLSAGQLRFAFLRADEAVLSISEANVLQLPLMSKAWVREVAWYYQGELQVKAKAIIPKSDAVAYQTLREWGDQPLGHLLYADSSMQEEAPQIVSPDAGYALHRQRIVLFQGHPVLISEQMTGSFFSTWGQGMPDE